MNASELRPGNIVLKGKEEYKVSAQDIADFESGKLDLKPAPLNEDGMEAFLIDPVKKGFYNLISGNCSIFVGLKNKQRMVNNATVPLDNMHQLQNTHFALSGTELNYKPIKK